MNAAGSVLIVDDHLALAENLAEIFEAEGLHAVIAASAEEAIDVVRAGDVVAMITDFRLPGQSGADLISELRRSGITIPAAIMSAYTDTETVARSRRAGAGDVFFKPADPTALLAWVTRALGHGPA